MPREGGSASADELHELAVKFGVQKPKPNFNAGPKARTQKSESNFNAGPKARTQKPGNPFDAKNFKSHDYDFNAKAKYWEDANRKRWENFHAEVNRMKADFEAKAKAQQQAKANFNTDQRQNYQPAKPTADSFKKFQRAARVGLGTAGAAYGGYKLYNYYKNRNKKGV